MIQDEAKEADEIADLVNRLALLHGDPELFHVIKDEAAVRLRRMAKRLRGDTSRRREPTTVWRPS